MIPHPKSHRFLRFQILCIFMGLPETGGQGSVYKTDRGREFYNRNLNNLSRQYNIKHYSTFSITNTAIVTPTKKKMINTLLLELKNLLTALSTQL